MYLFDKVMLMYIDLSVENDSFGQSTLENIHTHSRTLLDLNIGNIFIK